MIAKKIIGPLLIITFINLLSIAQDQKMLTSTLNRNSYTPSEKNFKHIVNQGISINESFSIAQKLLEKEHEESKAIPYLEYIVNKEGYKKENIEILLAKAYYFIEQFDFAIEIINKFIENTKNIKLKKEAKDDLIIYENAKNIFEKSLNIQLLNLGKNINSQFAEVTPFVSFEEDLLVFSSNRINDFNIFVSKKKNYKTAWETPISAGNYVNTKVDEFVSGLSLDGNDLLVHYNQTNEFIDINTSQRVKGIYNELGNLGNKVNSPYKEEGACISVSGDTLFIASDRIGGFGGFDLYYSLKLPNGQWGEAQNLGPEINTEFDENYPNLSIDGKALYFSSKGHQSIGGYDIFKAEYDDVNEKWQNITNIGYPLNNVYDNKTITFTDSPRYAYISSFLKKGFGDFDIYKAIFLNEEPDYLIVTSSIFIDNEKNTPFCDLNIPVNVSVYNDDVIYGLYSYDRLKNSFIMALIPGEYIIEVEADGYKTYNKKITINENHYKDKRRKLTIKLLPEQ
ncbi:MAG: PD40 domain-containing protein [Bacteroidales bacterium]|nr:PD40 domain-containing protein [Bacteroidales bacterium]MBN2758734.1 PD40 domain-containing protein [Bacteroidales bacterium]